MDDMETFRPAWWLPSSHLQTVWGRLARSRRGAWTEREQLTTPDGDELILDHLTGDPKQARVILLHGLEGSSNSVYIQGILRLLAQRRVAATVLNFRFCARDPQSLHEALPNRGRRLYHSGETSDLHFVIQTLRQREPERALLAFGASLGGNVLLKWLGEHPESDSIRRAATLSVPYDLGAGATYLDSRLGRIYVKSFVRTLLRKGKHLIEQHPELADVVDFERGAAATTFHEFDDAVTAPLHGFPSAADYYEQSSSIRFLHRINVPTLCVSAADDPFLPPVILDQAQRVASPAVQFALTSKGGHVGFVSGSPFRPRYWGEERVVAFLLGEPGF